jgi:hypothetical protein
MFVWDIVYSSFQKNRKNIFAVAFNLTYMDCVLSVYNNQFHLQTPIHTTTPASRLLHATLLAPYATLLARYDTLFARCDTLLARYDTLLARYERLLARYVTLLTRLHASSMFWSNFKIAWKWLKPEIDKGLDKEVIICIYECKHIYEIENK